jgi:hypothetical protein
MQLKQLPAWAAKMICTIFCADFLTMLLMNVFRLYTHWLPVLFFSLFIVAGFLIFRGRLISGDASDYVSAKERLGLTVLALGIGILFAGMRLPYLLEGHLHHLVGPLVYDDTWHFQEINSLVNSLRYPAQCSLIPNHYFSFYYAPWMLIAALYLALPVDGFTIKAAFAIGCAIYQILICLTLLHIAISKAKSRAQLYWAIYIFGFWAGTESLFSLLYYLRHNVLWTLMPGTPIHFPAFAVGAIWAIHHMSSAAALVLCWYVWSVGENNDWRTTACCSLLISYAFYSSIFVFLGALPIGIFAVLLALRDRWKTIVATICISGATIWPLLWLYLGKTNDVHFLFPFMTGVRSLFPFASSPGSLFIIPPHVLNSLDKPWPGFIVFIVFICLNFIPHFIALVFYGKRLSWPNFVFSLIAIGFLISTYFIGFPEGDNYASRGYVIPIIVLGWICAGLLPPVRISAWLVIGLLVGAFGFVFESIQTYKAAFRITHIPQPGMYSQEILAINQNRDTKVVAAADWSLHSGRIYDVEKFVAGGKQNLVTADRQLECLGPRGLWKWQQIPDVPER